MNRGPWTPTFITALSSKGQIQVFKAACWRLNSHQCVVQLRLLTQRVQRGELNPASLVCGGSQCCRQSVTQFVEHLAFQKDQQNDNDCFIWQEICDCCLVLIFAHQLQECTQTHRHSWMTMIQVRHLSVCEWEGLFFFFLLMFHVGQQNN